VAQRLAIGRPHTFNDEDRLTLLQAETGGARRISRRRANAQVVYGRSEALVAQERRRAAECLEAGPAERYAIGDVAARAAATHEESFVFERL